MTQNLTKTQPSITRWHRNLLVVTAVFSTLLIAMGGVLCVTQSIRNCPDWPGCFGTFSPPSQTGPFLEYTHRALAAITALLILGATITGLIRAPRVRWMSIPPLVAILLLVEVSYFGAVVVLRGLSPGWAALDVGSALLVVALMVAVAVTACLRAKNPGMPDQLSFSTRVSKLSMAALGVVYAVLVSGVLVAGKSSLTGCLGWPIYSLRLIQADGHALGNSLRLILSLAGIGLVVALLMTAWRSRLEHPTFFSLARWVGLGALLEAMVQIMLLVFGHPVFLLIIYTVTAAGFWALLVTLTVRVGFERSRS